MKSNLLTALKNNLKKQDKNNREKREILKKLWSLKITRFSEKIYKKERRRWTRMEMEEYMRFEELLSQ